MEASRTSAPGKAGRGHLYLLSVLGLVAVFIAVRDRSAVPALQAELEAKEPEVVLVEGASFERELARAVQLFEEHRFAEAEVHLAQARALEPDAPEVHFQSGLNSMGLRQLERAESELAMALELEPENARYVLGMAQVIGKQITSMEDSFAKIGLASRGKNLIEQAIAIDGELLDARLAKLLFCMMAPSILGGGIDRAREQILEISKVDPAVGLFAEGWLAEQEEEWESSEAHYRSSLELNDKYPRTRHRLGHLLMGQERFDEALVQFEAGLQLEPRSPASHDGKGLCLAGLGRYEEALRHFRRAAEIDPLWATPYFNEAECLIEQGDDLEAARAAFSRFLEVATHEDEERIEQASRWLEQHSPAR